MATSDFRLGSDVRRITILTPDGSGRVQPTVLYEGRSRKKKQSRRLKPFETVVRHTAEAVGKGLDVYVVRHERSNAKKKDGWFMDMQRNMYKGMRKGSNRMKMNRFLSMMSM